MNRLLVTNYLKLPEEKGRRQRQQVILELEGMQSICYLVF